MSTDHSPAPEGRPHTGLRIAGCAALGVIGAMTAGGCLLTLWLEHLSFFGVRPQVPITTTIALLAGAAAAIVIPAAVAIRVLRTRGQRFVVAAGMLAVALLGVVLVTAVLGV